MKHEFERRPHAVIPNVTQLTCKLCGKVRLDGLSEEAVAVMYEDCPGKPGVHQWAPAPGPQGFMEPPVCAHCGQSQRGVHPHDPCPGAPGHTDLMISPEAIDEALDAITPEQLTADLSVSDEAIDAVPVERLLAAVARRVGLPHD